MLNKIWAGLIIVGIVFALAQDINDEIQNTYQNGIARSFHYSSSLQVSDLSEITSPHITQISILIAQQKLNAHIKINQVKNNQQLHIFLNDQSPQFLNNIAALNGNRHLLIASIVSKDNHQLTILLPELHWQKLRAITQAAFDIAGFAVKLAIGLIGIMALWLGLMQIAEKSGLIKYMVKAVQPLLSWLFPNIPKDHPAFGSISLNMTANILGLGNAATPLGIKAMQQLQQLNSNKEKASDEMCMFLALNTSSVQLLPPVTLIALMGTQVSELIIPIILATSCSTIAAVSVAKFYARRAQINRRQPN